MTPRTARPLPEIGRIVAHARAFRPQKEGTVPVSVDSIQGEVARLWALLRERRIEFVLVGGIALLQYVDGRNTEDIDLIVASSALDRLAEMQIDDRNEYFALGRLGDLRIDLLLTDNPLFAKVQERYAAPRAFAGDTIPCATVEGLLLLKLYALPSLYRSGDFARVSLYENDIAALMQAYRPALEPLLDEVARHLSSTDLGEVRSIVKDIQGRIERFDAAQDETT